MLVAVSPGIKGVLPAFSVGIATPTAQRCALVSVMPHHQTALEAMEPPGGACQTLPGAKLPRSR